MLLKKIIVFIYCYVWWELNISNVLGPSCPSKQIERELNINRLKTND